MSNNSPRENQSSNIQQKLLNNNDVGRDLNLGDINQESITNNIETQIIIQGDAPERNSSRARYRDNFEPLIDNRLTLFGGRDRELTKIAEFINKPIGGYLVIKAPAGFGKTSLMAKLVNEAQETFAYHFFNRYENSNQERIVLLKSKQ